MSRRKTLKRVLQYIDKYKYYLIISILFATVTVALTLYAPILIGNAIDLIVGKSNVDFSGIIRILVRLGIIIGATAVLQWLMNVCNNKITYNVSRDLRQQAFEKIERVPISYIDNHPSGDASPSPEDLNVTRRIKEAGQLLGIALTDHIIIGEHAYVSLREEHYL